jgi:demethylmenaquinone methyltransferase/2-methoxy-6-polyprenyl-1,4-benzoquinol methylase
MTGGRTDGRTGGRTERTLDPADYLASAERRRAYVNAVFATIAPSYDRFTRWFSFGMDARWKRHLVGWLLEVLRPGDVVLDLACGTGDIGRAVERLSGWPVVDSNGTSRPALVVGLDPSAAMLRLASSRRRARRGAARPLNRSTAQPLIRLLRADMTALPVRTGSVAVVTVGYGFRNVADARLALAEVARVLKPRGWLFDLDFFRPVSPSWRSLYLWYLRQAGRLFGRLWHGEPEAYGYIARSLQAWLTPTGFEALLREEGFEVVKVAQKLGGGICLHGARRAALTAPAASSAS